MGTYKTKCDICYTENEVPTYGDWDCSECHQPYEYDEGHRIHLTDAQLEWLRQGRLTDAEREAIRSLAPSGDPLASRTVTLTPDVRRVLHGLLTRTGGTNG